ncbi:MAG: hypothetical protein R6U19_09780 [Bacteroidales bacterium]
MDVKLAKERPYNASIKEHNRYGLSRYIDELAGIPVIGFTVVL